MSNESNLTPAPAAVAVPDERDAYIHWLTSKHPDVYTTGDAMHWWGHGHVSALAWQARASLAAAPAQGKVSQDHFGPAQEHATQLAGQEPEARPGFALVPLRLTRAMDDVLAMDGWQWPDLLAAAEAITAQEYAALAAAPQAPAAPVAVNRSQHDADSRELRKLCIARDAARSERDLARVEIAGLQASTSHLSALVDGQCALLEKAKAAMTALHGAASLIDESGGDLDARISASAFARFVDEHAALLHAMAQSPVAAPAAPAVDAREVERDAAFEAVRQRLCGLQRYSFVLDDDGVVRRVQDRTGNWIEFDDAHELFDPVAVDAAIAAQAKGGE